MSSHVSIHGRNHRPGGVDPIPGLPTSSPTAGSYAETVVTIPDLLGYWRLGETGEPFADTSGTSPPADLDYRGSGTAPTPNVPGALVSDDDGAIEFNYNGTSATDAAGRMLTDNAITDGSVYRFADLHALTVSAWVKTKASAVTRRGHVVGSIAQDTLPPYDLTGWALEVLYPSRQVRFTRSEFAASGGEHEVTTTGGINADEWYFAVGTFDLSDVRLYLNAALVGETADTRSQVGAANSPLLFGGQGGNMPQYAGQWFYGTVDEVAIWSRALIPDEIETLYASGSEVGTPAGGSVLVSDGEGGSEWGQVTTPAIADEAVTPAKIEPGADGEVLRTSGTDVEWGLATVRVNY